MLNLRRSLVLVLMTAGVVGFASITRAQDADADLAKNELGKGIALYKTMQYRPAKATLLKVNRADLSDADRKTLDEYLGMKLDKAIKANMAAMSAYKSGERALKAGKLAEAKAHFARAAASEYLPAAMRLDAKARLAESDKKIVVADAADRARAKRDDTPAPVKVARADKTESKPPSAVKEKPAEKSVPEEKKRDILAETEARLKKVREMIAKGQKALDDNQPERAVRYFQRALALAPEHDEAKRRLNYARQMTATVGQGGIISRLERRRRIARQAANTEFDAALKRSEELLARAESAGATGFDAAADAARVGQNVLEINKSLYSEQEYRERLTRVEQLLAHITAQRNEWNRRRAQDQAVEIAEAEAKRVRRQQQRLRQKISSLTGRAQELQSEQRYGQSLEVARQILKLDPDNAWAGSRVDLLQQFVLLQENRQAHRDQRLQEKKELVELRRAEIPWWDLIKYPSDWKELTLRREPFSAGKMSESAVDRQVRQQLQSRIPALDLPDLGLEDVIEFMRELSTLNFHVKWTALEQVGIDKSTTVNVRLTNVTVEKALETILDDVGAIGAALGYVIDEGVITISTKDDLSARTLTRVYDIRDLIVRVPNFIAPQIDLGGGSGGGGGGGGYGGGGGGGYGGGSGGGGGGYGGGGGGGGGGGLFGGGGGGGRGGGGGTGGQEENTPTRAEIIENITELITTTIDEPSWRPTGEVGSIRELGGQLVVTQTAENHEALMDLIAQLREARALQISIEARFISVSTGFLNSIGLDLDFFFNIGSRLGSGSVVDPFTGTVVPTTTGSSGWGSNKPGNNKWTPMGVSQNSGGRGDWGNVLGGVGSGIGSQLTEAALSIGGTFLDDIQVNFLIEATQASEHTRSLTAPRLTLFNGQRAYVMVATEQAYVSDLEPEISENVVAYNPTVDVIPTGSVLDVEAVISADRRYVTLTVRPSVTALIGFTTYAITTIETDANGVPIVGEGFIQLPKFTIQLLETTVSVPDGGTLLLGGQRTSSEIEREMGVPLLDKVPILNRLFSNRGMVRDEQTLLILIRPKIIIQREEEERQYPD